MCGFDGVRIVKYVGGEPIKRTNFEARVGKLKNKKSAGKDEVTEEMIKDESNRVVDCIWRLCNMGFLVVLCQNTRGLL